MAINIPSSVFTKYKEAVDAMIDTFGVPCTLVYPGKIETASVDLPTHKTIKRVSVNNSAPAGFTYGEDDLRVADTTDSITLRVYWSQRDLSRAGFTNIGDYNIPADSILTIGYLSDLDKVQRAEFLIANTNFAPYGEYKFEKAMDPQPWGMLQDRYFLCIWKRA